MKKTIKMMLLSAMMMAACVSIGSCSSDDDADGAFSEKRVGNYIMGISGIGTTVAASSDSTATDW